MLNAIFIVSLAKAIPLLSMLLKWNKLSSNIKDFFWYFLAGVIFEIALFSVAYNGNENLIIRQYYALMELVVLSFVFYRITYIKHIVIVGAGLFLLFTGSVFLRPGSYSSETYGLNCLFYIVCSYLSIKSVEQSYDKSDLFKSMLFCMLSINLAYYTSCLFSFIQSDFIHNNLTNDHLIAIFMIPVFMNFICNALYTYVIWTRH